MDRFIFPNTFKTHQLLATLCVLLPTGTTCIMVLSFCNRLCNCFNPKYTKSEIYTKVMTMQNHFNTVGTQNTTKRGEVMQKVDLLPKLVVLINTQQEAIPRLMQEQKRKECTFKFSNNKLSNKNDKKKLMEHHCAKFKSSGSCISSVCSANTQFK